MSDFQRARTSSQRLQRQEDIVRAATEMLEEMSVSELTLTGLSHRVGLAKSNVIRYFETREVVLLELLDRLARRFLEELQAALPPSVIASAPAYERCRVVAGVVAACFEARPMLCELLSAQAGVLERNVSVEAATRFKLGSRDNLNGFADALRREIPELDERQAAQAARTIVALAGAIWTQSQPAPTIRAAVARDPRLSFFVVPFRATLAGTAAAVLAGLLALDGDGVA